MYYSEAGSETPIIRRLAHSIDEDRCTLRWLWPDTIQAVYVHKAADRLAAERPPVAELKLYTRDEYKANNGYHDRIDGIGRLVYTIYACLLQEDGQQQLVIQQDGGNRIALSTGRARICYSIRYKGGWFKTFKTAQIQVAAEVPLPADVLCYVKKHGGYPASKDDGTVYPFVEPFAPGRNMLPEIEIGKDDYIRLFFTDGRQYGQLYELIPE
ncbi:beta-mannanase [Paenibacillus sp. chi10]|uniref:Beta-mannanase n=1 Tax=Paenibacillus suaedae TaxID=3077233 RepID=A0AAJ2JV28_9BACL|nr:MULTISPECIES: beta-mannanase [unclassified Paenibacillus]MDT8976401.1 beta-mannanase [Paenibacillus sp. chi10]GAV11660.1 hypothetical protein PBN151_1589 [Paenibacillus sp. NAIST15-1]